MVAGMGKTQLRVVNSRIRQLFQKYYEFRVLRKQLDTHQIDLIGGVILDAGCGSGYSSQLIAKNWRPKELYACDLMPEQIELAKQRGLDAHLFVGDVADLHLDSEIFDAVFSFGLFHHVPQWPRALAEVHRVLKPGGVLAGGEISQEKELGFRWSEFAQDLKEARFDLLTSQKIYLGYFHSFLAMKPKLDRAD